MADDEDKTPEPEAAVSDDAAENTAEPTVVVEAAPAETAAAELASAAEEGGKVGTSPIYVKLPIFEGPLDLLVHLVKKNEYDIFDIPILQVTEQYIAYIDLMKSLNLDVAGDFLVMAATLMRIKARMLLPPSDEGDEDEGEDPREELARQLAEYMRYKQAAEELGDAEQLGRELFARKFTSDDLAEAAAQEGRLEVSIFELIDAFGKMIKERRIDMPHEVIAERVSVAQRINEVLDRMREKGAVTFLELFEKDASKIDLIVTFLALLEIMRLSLARAYQSAEFAEIHIALRDDVMADEDGLPDLDDGSISSYGGADDADATGEGEAESGSPATEEDDESSDDPSEEDQ